MTIYLYLKQHSVTGLKYFGKTTGNVITYDGSGSYWIKHINKHGREYIETLGYWEFESQEECTQFALAFSEENNIVNDKINGKKVWANLRVENGADGNPSGSKLSESHKRNIGLAGKGRIPVNKGCTHSPEIRKKISDKIKGRIFSDEHRKNLAKGSTGAIFSEERRRKIGEASKGRSPPNKGIPQEKIKCPHCDTIGGLSIMKRWHLDNCKFIRK